MTYPEDYASQIINGDCREVIQGIPDGSIDLVLTDPPFGIAYQSNRRTASPKFPAMSGDTTDIRLEVYRELYRVMADNSALVAFCSYKNYPLDFQFLSSIYKVRNVVVWFKGGGGIGDLTHSLSTDYELAIVAHKGACRIRGKRCGSVWRVAKVPSARLLHPTEKPTALLEIAIEKFSDRGATVLDPFIGSGTTAVACKQLGRNFIGVELDPHYAEIARARVAAIPTPLDTEGAGE